MVTYGENRRYASQLMRSGLKEESQNRPKGEVASCAARNNASRRSQPKSKRQSRTTSSDASLWTRPGETPPLAQITNREGDYARPMSGGHAAAPIATPDRGRPALRPAKSGSNGGTGVAAVASGQGAAADCGRDGAKASQRHI
ncbi:hypothetical protein VTO73DRAFT_15605 [Trametes versicolor]